MRRAIAVAFALALIAVCALARVEIAACGTGNETALEHLFLHRQSIQHRATIRPRDTAAPLPDADIGNIAVIHDRDGIVERQNQFNLDGFSLTFQLASGAYRYSLASGGYDAAAAQGTPLVALDDDDSRAVNLPFSFPFYGTAYTQVFVNSDGNLTFSAADHASTPRTLSRMTAGPPRISPLFDDLDPSRTAGGVRVLSDSSRVVVSWVNVPEYSAFGNGNLTTFQVALFPDGRIQFAWSGANPAQAVVGIAPGNLQPPTAIVDFRTDPSAAYTAAVSEVFTNSLTIDPVLVAQHFYQSHDDAFDYLVIYNNMDIPAMGEGTVAYEQTVRNVTGTGYGVPIQDSGVEFGSASRLQSMLNLGPLSQYPVDPSTLVPARAPQGDTPLSIITHEAGHLFLAFASVRDPNNSSSLPMLGYQAAHWSFLFNSEASVMEGERIVDRGSSASPRFLTTDTEKQYAPMDQYLLGFRPPDAVPDTFYVIQPNPNYLPTLHPYSGISFDGTRINVSAADVARAMGRRTPDSTVAQRRFRFAFILVVPGTSQPSVADLAQIDNYRRQFEAFYVRAASNNASADTSLARSMKLSLFPWSGVPAGSSGTASITLQTPPVQPLTVSLSAPGGHAGLPASIVIPAGSISASFAIDGLNPGVEEVQAIPSDSSYETAFARVQVAGASILQLVQVTPPAQMPGAVAARLTDINNIVYSQVRLTATPSPNGVVIPSDILTDAAGQAVFHWDPGPAATSQLRIAVAAMPSVNLTLRTAAGVPAIASVVNAASQLPGISPGAWATATGGNLADAAITLNGEAVKTATGSATAITFLVPPDAALGAGTLTVTSSAGVAANFPVTIALASPGIFPNGILHNGTNAALTPVRAGDALEIYCTGLGPTITSAAADVTTISPVVFMGATPVTPFFSGLSNHQPGVYQINVRVPDGLAPGTQQVIVSVNLAHSNPAPILVQ
jgi:uncharacterized protein (TIGR03437 family)